MATHDKKESLIRALSGQGYLRSERVRNAFRDIRREAFLPRSLRDYAYEDEPLPIGSDQTISAPHMVAVMTELLKPEKSDTVLEVGSGSGYQAAILSGLVRKVHTIELDPGLARSSRDNLRKAGIMNVDVLEGDGSLGLPGRAFDKIMVTCASDRIYRPWIDQLKESGLILVPLKRGHFQALVLGNKIKGELKTRDMMGVVFVPLRH